MIIIIIIIITLCAGYRNVRLSCKFQVLFEFSKLKLHNYIIHCIEHHQLYKIIIYMNRINNNNATMFLMFEILHYRHYLL